uniref:DUF4150 domain-containing protein n=1 Tax=Rhabditophanes sp. KR3021 TaxID=114890 RepID=A0AC35TMP6_9BILA
MEMMPGTVTTGFIADIAAPAKIVSASMISQPTNTWSLMNVATPYNGGVPVTPEMSFDAMTPASNLASGSKGQTAHFDNHMRSGCWAMVGMHVKVISDTKLVVKNQKCKGLVLFQISM